MGLAGFRRMHKRNAAKRGVKPSQKNSALQTQPSFSGPQGQSAAAASPAPAEPKKPEPESRPHRR